LLDSTGEPASPHIMARDDITFTDSNYMHVRISLVHREEGLGGIALPCRWLFQGQMWCHSQKPWRRTGP
jgi:hypothetical protein